jgi:DNA polymerase I
MKKVFLVDVSSMFFRAFYAIRPLSNPAGMPVNAIYGFLTMTLKLMREAKPDYMAFCFDRPEPSFRIDIDPRYKANRSEMPEDLVPQIPYIKKLSLAMGIPCFEQKGFEADDIIGTVTQWGRANQLEVVIVSGDKDFAQLVQPFVTLYDTMKEARYGEAGVLEKWGVRPDQIIDYMSLVGDSSDNIAGVAGIGPKGAQKLISEFGTLDGIYQNLPQIKSDSTRLKLETGREEAYLSQKLVTIDTKMDLTLSVDELRIKPIERAALRELLTELDFKSIAKTLLGDEISTATPPALSIVATIPFSKNSGLEIDSASGLTVETGDSRATEVSSENISHLDSDMNHQADFFSSDKSSSAPAVSEQFIPNAQLQSRLDSISAKDLKSWLADVEELWLMPHDRGLALAAESSEKPGSSDGDRLISHTWKIAEISGDSMDLSQALAEFKGRLSGYDIKSLARKWSFRVTSVGWDHQLAAYVLKTGEVESFENLVKFYIGQSLSELPTLNELISANLNLKARLNLKLEQISGLKILNELDLPLVPILIDMETSGIKIDPELLRVQSLGLAKEIQVLDQDIQAISGQSFNVASPKQLSVVLFEKLLLPPGKKTKTGFSTDNEVLEGLKAQHPIVAKVLEFRELSKLKSTYVDTLPQQMDSRSRIHSSFNQALTTTGRLSSNNPNLQNIPIRTARGLEVRKAFIAEKDHCLVTADYSQIELRVLAHITQDKGLAQAFADRIDIHRATASEVFGVALTEVTSEMRRMAKAVNFGLAYGQSAFGLAETLGISRGEASDIIKKYFIKFPGVQTYMSEIVEKAKTFGYVETVLGRRRYIDQLKSSNNMIKKFGERAAINAPIQGTASDIVKIAMIKAAKEISAPMILQVHDELVFEVPLNEAESVRSRLIHIMESAVKLSVPLEVNSGVGPNWDAAHA